MSARLPSLAAAAAARPRASYGKLSSCIAERECETDELSSSSAATAPSEGRGGARMVEDEKEQEKKRWQDAVRELGGLPAWITKSKFYDEWVRDGKIFPMGPDTG